MYGRSGSSCYIILYCRMWGGDASKLRTSGELFAYFDTTKCLPLRKKRCEPGELSGAREHVRIEERYKALVTAPGVLRAFFFVPLGIYLQCSLREMPLWASIVGVSSQNTLTPQMNPHQAPCLLPSPGRMTAQAYPKQWPLPS